MNEPADQGMRDAEALADATAVKALPMMFHAQFIRDISFENPQPAALFGDVNRPAMDVGFSIECLRVESQNFKFMYEVQTGLKVQARRDNETVFLTEILYSVLVSLDGVPEEQHHPLLYIEAPRFAFPYIRQIVSTLTQNAGMMPLLLTPVDFRALYMQRFGEEIRKSQAASA